VYHVLRKQSSAPILNSLGKRGYSTISNRSADNDLDYHASDKLALITNALEEATSLIKSHGLVPGTLFKPYSIDGSKQIRIHHQSISFQNPTDIAVQNYLQFNLLRKVMMENTGDYSRLLEEAG